MRIFLDANILVSVLNKEYPLFPFTSRIVSLSERPGFKLYTSPLCLAIAFYFSEKKHSTIIAKKKIEILCQHIHIAKNSAVSVQNTIINKSIHDFEDGLEYYAALEENCTCIITEDKEDYYFSEIPIYNSKEFCTDNLKKL